MRTADQSDSWLILYNVNNSESINWKNFYIDQWNIPAENTLGLYASNDEKITRDEFHSTIFYPVQSFLLLNPEIEQKIMGILVGYRVPGNFYLEDHLPPLQGGGGWSVSNNLQDMTSPISYRRPNPYFFGAHYNPTFQQLTKENMLPGKYLSARMDAPTLGDAKVLTYRTKEFMNSDKCLFDQYLYYDYFDIGSPPGDEWTSLKHSVFGVDENRNHTSYPNWCFPWLSFNSNVDIFPDCAIYFSYYQLTDWQSELWNVPPLVFSGSRIIAYAMNSWGATTVRSVSDHNERFVPNALFNSYHPFLSAIGATAEPYVSSSPLPSTIVWCLSLGWTAPEAFCCSSPEVNHMWEIVGDPMLRVPLWFAMPPDLNKDGEINEEDVIIFSECQTGSGIVPEKNCRICDFDHDHDVDQSDFGILQRCFGSSI